MPLAPATREAIATLRVATSSGVGLRTGTAHGETDAETIATDDGNVVFAWNAQQFPGVRILPEGSTNATYASGLGTFEQVTVATAARALKVDFSDGVRSVERTFTVFGR